MRGLQKSKRVTWASDASLCQVRLFLSEESPSQVSFGAQDHLQAKASGLPHSTGTAPDDILPPGFEGGHPSSISHIKASDVPVIKWKSPPRFVVNLTWQVVSGEESAEVEVQNQREMRVFEAVYPRPSAIPSNPAFTPDAEDSEYNDSQIPLIPILPIEDEDADAADIPYDSAGSYGVSMFSQPQPFVPGIPPLSTNLNTSGTPHNERAGGEQLGVEPDIVAAAFAAINKGTEQGSIIDQDLLIKILSNPEFVGKLVTNYGSTSSTQNIPKPAGSFVSSSDPTPRPVALSDPSHLHMSRVEPSVPLVATSSGSFYSQPNGIAPMSHPNTQVPLPGVSASSGLSSMGNPQVKDLNYYKSLIQQHGGERQENSQQYSNRYGHQMVGNQDLVNQKPRDTKHKFMKPCIYFNSSRGCLHGVNCAYQHDPLSQQKSGNTMPEVKSAKRMKMDWEISS